MRESVSNSELLTEKHVTEIINHLNHKSTTDLVVVTLNASVRVMPEVGLHLRNVTAVMLKVDIKAKEEISKNDLMLDRVKRIKERVAGHHVVVCSKDDNGKFLVGFRSPIKGLSGPGNYAETLKEYFDEGLWGNFDYSQAKVDVLRFITQGINPRVV